MSKEEILSVANRKKRLIYQKDLEDANVLAIWLSLILISMSWLFLIAYLYQN